MKKLFSNKTMGIIIKVREDGDFSVFTGGNLENLPDDERMQCEDILTGLSIMLDKSQEVLGMLGGMSRMVHAFTDDHPEPETDEDFPDALRERLSGDNIIPLFNKDKLN